MSFANEQSIAITQQTCTDNEVRSLISQKSIHVDSLKEKLKGVPGIRDIYILSS